ncbi:MAG: phosphoheptose isomerase, partial [Candidatus Omnitrophota bacterium]
SSSGASKNILNACDEANLKGMKIITLSGFLPDNPLRTKGDINFWIDSKAFGFLEILHGLILHWINDSIIGKEEYYIK